MSTTKAASVSEVPGTRGAPAGWIKHELFDGRVKRPLGKQFGLTQFGVNHTTLEPGAYSALRHWHQGEDEFVFVLEGRLTLIDDNGEHILGPGQFCVFPAGVSNAHHLANLGSEPASFLEVGSRRRGEDVVHYPDDDFGPIRR
jgi:uncharacterized cupin superfamily protein